jgi:hypothetical protein
VPEKHVVFALIERRARLAGELRTKQAEVLSLRRALASVDLCIRMFKADYQPEAIRPKVTLARNPAGLPKGAGYRNALEILRETGQAFTAAELAYLALERLGKEPSEAAVSMLAKTIHSSFKRQRNPVVTYDRSSTWPGSGACCPNRKPDRFASGGDQLAGGESSGGGGQGCYPIPFP